MINNTNGNNNNNNDNERCPGTRSKESPIRMIPWCKGLSSTYKDDTFDYYEHICLIVIVFYYYIT